METSKLGFEAKTKRQSGSCEKSEERRNVIKDRNQDFREKKISANLQKIEKMNIPEMEPFQKISSVFGSLADILFFFPMINSKIYDFSQEFTKIEGTEDLDGLKKNIIPQIIACIQDLFRPYLNEKSSKQYQILQNLTKSLNEDVNSFADFYKHLFKAYTEPSDLYRLLNRLQMNGQWSQLKDLLKYSFCLCRAFYLLKENKDFQFQKSENSEFMILYRGLALDESKIKWCKQSYGVYISWKQFISTSLDIDRAKFFARNDESETKLPVVFIIEVPITNHVESIQSEHSRFLNLSGLSKEQELLLFPGSIFEIIEVLESQQEITKIRIRLKSNIQSLINKGSIMIGSLLRRMTNDRGMKVTFCSGNQLSEYLKFLIGYTLIQNLEFCVCEFDDETFEDLIKLLQTLKGLKLLKFISCSYEGEKREMKKELASNLDDLNFREVQFTEINDFSSILNLQWKYWELVERLIITFTRATKIADETINNQASLLKNLPSLKSLTLNFFQIEKISDQGFKDFLSKVAQFCPQLAFLEIDFQDCQNIKSDFVRDLHSRKNELFPQQSSLNLIVHEKKKSLDDIVPKKFYKFISLDNQNEPDVNLTPKKDLSELKVIDNKSKLEELMQQFKTSEVSPFTSLSIKVQVFFDSDELSLLENVLESKSCSKLTFLHLDFKGCPESKVTNGFINSICLHGRQNINGLESLKLDLEGCKKLTDDAVLSISDWLSECPQLASLRLSLHDCLCISDEGISHLASGFEPPSKIKSLDLNFTNCNSITGDRFSSGWLETLSELESFTLNLSFCPKIPDKRVTELFEALQFCKDLKHISMNFGSCTEITDKQIPFICSSEIIKYLSKLISFEINFENCPNVTELTLLNLIKWLETIARFRFENPDLLSQHFVSDERLK